MPKKEFAEGILKAIIRKSKIYTPFISNIWGSDFADIKLISKFDKGIRFLLCVIDNFSKKAWVIPSKDKKGITITIAFQKILDESIRKPSKLWVEKGT